VILPDVNKMVARFIIIQDSPYAASRIIKDVLQDYHTFYVFHDCFVDRPGSAARPRTLLIAACPHDVGTKRAVFYALLARCEERLGQNSHSAKV
jgi:hypothetical protein